MSALTALLLLACGPAAAQAGPSAPAVVETVELPQPKRPSPTAAAPLALALDLALGASVWAQIQVSTSGQVVDVTKLVREGFYKLEIVELVLLSAKAKKPLKETVEKRRKGARLSGIAADYRVDYEKLYEEALAVEELVDREYLPRFYQRKQRRRFVE